MKSTVSLERNAMEEATPLLHSECPLVSTIDAKPMVKATKQSRVLLVSSSGGHWVQMNRIKQAFQGEQLYYASTERDYRQTISDGRFYYVPDASKASSIFKILWQAFSVLLLVLRVRPNVVISTGAAPGFFAIVFAKKLGAKTIWLDSIANVDKVSLSGAKAAKHADLFLTQWEHLACKDGPEYFGSVL